VQIAIVTVAADLRIRRFTPMAERVLNLIPTDIGRRISDIKPNIDYPDLEQMIVEAIESISLQEREVLDREGNRYALRVRPYKNVDNRIDGAVLALFEISTTTSDPRGEAARCLREQAVAMIDSMNEPVLLLEPDLTVRSANAAFLSQFALPRDEVEGRSVFELPQDGKLDPERLKGLLEEELPKNHTVQSYAVGDGSRPLLANARRIRGEFGAPGVIVLSLAEDGAS
jgi:two-component system CheB/CheR fusion protein